MEVVIRDLVKPHNVTMLRYEKDPKHFTLEISSDTKC